MFSFAQGKQLTSLFTCVPRLTFQLGLSLSVGKRKPIWNMSLDTSAPGIAWGWHFHAFLLFPGEGGALQWILMGCLSDRHSLQCCTFTGRAGGSLWGYKVAAEAPMGSLTCTPLEAAATLLIPRRGEGSLWGFPLALSMLWDKSSF